MNLEAVFRQFIEKEQLTAENLLLSVSGGVDSCVLLDVATKCVDTEHLAVFHLDHGNRAGAEAAFFFVQNLCSKHKITFYGYRLSDIPKQNREATWREQRRGLAAQAQTDFGAERILTAHHATDLVETMLFRLTKGCGVAGLSPFKTRTKPFWNVPQADLIAYAAAHKLQWHEDETNADLSHERNLIRHEVLPALRKITPNLEPVFVRESELFGEVQAFLNECIHPLVKHVPNRDQGGDRTASGGAGGFIALSEFQNLPPILQKELLRHIAAKTPSASEIDDCLRWLLHNPEGGSQKTIGGTKLQIAENKLHW